MRRAWTHAVASFMLLFALGNLTRAEEAPKEEAPAAEAPAEDAPPAARPSEDRPVKAIERALIISIDGGRPDMLLRAETPNLRKLLKAGSFTFWAQTVPASVTLPSHTSMLTGVDPEKHGVNWNEDLPAGSPRVDPKVPTIFEVAKAHGLKTAMVAGKTKFDTLAKVGVVDHAWIKSAGDEQVGDAAVQMIREQSPDVLFVHFPSCDGAGHGHGWGSPQQIQAAETVDRQLGKLLDVVDQGKTLIIISADHGGAGRSHGADDPRSRHIPWIAAGPGLRKEYDLTR